MLDPNVSTIACGWPRKLPYRLFGVVVCVAVNLYGAGGETRTHDLGIMRPSLYP